VDVAKSAMMRAAGTLVVFVVTVCPLSGAGHDIGAASYRF
jgi:hypothetical protein